MKPIWVFDNRLPSNPVSISTFPLATDNDYLEVGGHYGPHNVISGELGRFDEFFEALHHQLRRRRCSPRRSSDGTCSSSSTTTTKSIARGSSAGAA